jgi:fructose-bisphosphate aldolase, class II
MRISTSQLFEKAYTKFAIGAFNIFTMEQIIGLFKGADSCGAPIIVAITPVARRYASAEMLGAMVNAAAELYPNVVFAVHLDHGNVEHCNDAILSGNYNSVMIDASYEPFEKNAEITADIAKTAHTKGMDVEAELGVLSGVEDDKSVDDKDALFTNPDQAYEFVNKTNCDSLAVAIGTSHGAYKFGGNSGLRLDILKEIQTKLLNYPIVLHGASAIPVDEVKRINNAGGDLSSSAKGTNPGELLEAIKLGVCKINIATDARLLWTRVHREFFRDEPEKFDPILPGQQYIDEFAKFVVSKCQLLGAAGKHVLYKNREEE